MATLESQDRIHEFNIWLHLECLLPFILVLMAAPIALYIGADEDKFWHAALEALSEAELPAVAFCMLVPTTVIGLQHRCKPAVGFLLVLGALYSIMCYTVCKMWPVSVEEASQHQTVIYRSLSGLLLMIFTVFMSIRVRSAIYFAQQEEAGNDY